MSLSLATAAGEPRMKHACSVSTSSHLSHRQAVYLSGALG
jgi:hypothetical protein